jgi:hypothetical protein
MENDGHSGNPSNYPRVFLMSPLGEQEYSFPLPLSSSARPRYVRKEDSEKPVVYRALAALKVS